MMVTSWFDGQLSKANINGTRKCAYCKGMDEVCLVLDDNEKIRFCKKCWEIYLTRYKTYCIMESRGTEMKYFVSNINGLFDSRDAAFAKWIESGRPCDIDEKVWITTLSISDNNGVREALTTETIAKGMVA